MNVQIVKPKERNVIFEMTESEAKSIGKILGKLSQNDVTDGMGLNASDHKVSSVLWNILYDLGVV